MPAVILRFYGYKKCATCRKAEKHLEARKIPYAFTDITEKPPEAAELGRLIKISGRQLSAFYNTSGELYKSMKIKDRRVRLTDAEQIALLAAHGRLLKRPLLVGDKRVTVGFGPEEAATWV